MVKKFADEAGEMTAHKDFFTEEFRDDRSIIGLYLATDSKSPEDFKVQCEKNGW